MARFCRYLNELMRNIGFHLQSTNKERIHAVVLTQSEGQLSQYGVVFIAKRQRRFTFFINASVSARINAVALLVFSSIVVNSAPWADR